jgi:hypothetical protein
MPDNELPDLGVLTENLFRNIREVSQARCTWAEGAVNQMPRPRTDREAWQAELKDLPRCLSSSVESLKRRPKRPPRTRTDAKR